MGSLRARRWLSPDAAPAFIRLPFPLITSVAGRKRRAHKENHAGSDRPFIKLAAVCVCVRSLF